MKFISTRDFNSIMVRLKPEFMQNTNATFNDFNSIMVRLKPIQLEICCKSTEFQFHYGTIKTRKIALSSFITEISIPLWYD